MIKLIGKKINELRKSSGLSVEEFCRKAGISKTVLYYYEAGERKPPIDMIYSLNRAFGISADWLLGISDSQHVINLDGIGPDGVKILSELAEILREKPQSEKQ